MSFVIFIVASNIIVGIGAYRVWEYTCTIFYPLIHSSTWQMLMEDCAQPVERRNVPPPHPHSLTWLRLDFGFRKWKPLRIWPCVFLTTSRYPLAPALYNSQYSDYSDSNASWTPGEPSEVPLGMSTTTFTIKIGEVTFFFFFGLWPDPPPPTLGLGSSFRHPLEISSQWDGWSENPMRMNLMMHKSRCKVHGI